MPRPVTCIDVEASGPVPGLGDMISFAAVIVEPGLARQWHSGIMLPTCEEYNPGAYASIGMTREVHLAAQKQISERVPDFVAWLQAMEPDCNRFIMLSDNPGFDFMWVNYWLHHLRLPAILGHSARRIGDAWAGLRKRPQETQGWKKLRRTKHTHDPLDDCVGNAEAWLAMWEKYGE